MTTKANNVKLENRSPVIQELERYREIIDLYLDGIKLKNENSNEEKIYIIPLSDSPNRSYIRNIFDRVEKIGRETKYKNIHSNCEKVLGKILDVFDDPRRYEKEIFLNLPIDMTPLRSKMDLWNKLRKLGRSYPITNKNFYKNDNQ